jgi:hypothetical protein
MRIDKQQVVRLLRSRGEQDLAQRARAELPEPLDSDQHADQLARFGIDPRDVLGDPDIS